MHGHFFIIFECGFGDIYVDFYAKKNIFEKSHFWESYPVIFDINLDRLFSKIRKFPNISELSLDSAIFVIWVRHEGHFNLFNGWWLWICFASKSNPSESFGIRSNHSRPNQVHDSEIQINHQTDSLIKIHWSG